MRHSIAALIVGGGLGVLSCLADRAYQCGSDEHCLAAADGVCSTDQWCAYPDDACASGMAYGPHAPPTLAGACLDAEAGEGTAAVTATAGEDGSEESGETGTDIGGRCGDNIVDPGETCDDGNRLPGDGCHPQCVDPGTPTWTVSWDGEAHSEDRGYAVAVHAAADAVYVTGFTTVDEMDYDILVQRYALETGELQWTEQIEGGQLGDDVGEHIAVDSAGNVVVAGRVATADADADVWLAKLNPQGELLWETTYDEAGLYDTAQGVAILEGDVIVVSAQIGVTADDSDLWVQRFDSSGNAVGDPMQRNLDLMDAGIDIIARPGEYQITGMVGVSPGDARVWTSHYTEDGTLQWEHEVTTGGDNGPWPRGVGQAFNPLGGSAIAGVITTDLLVQHYDEAGVAGEQILIDGPQGSHDEASDVGFSSDGSYVVAGFLDFRTEGFMTSDSWVRRYAADHTELWTDRYEGPSKEIDKALAVVVTEDLSAVVVGYDTVPGSARNLWLRRYAL